MLSTETLLHIWLSTEYYGFRQSSTAVDMVSLHALDPTEPRKRKHIGFLLAPEVSNFVSNLLLRITVAVEKKRIEQYTRRDNNIQGGMT